MMHCCTSCLFLWDSDRWERCNMGRIGPQCESRKPKSQLSCHTATCVGELDYPAISVYWQTTEKDIIVCEWWKHSGQLAWGSPSFCCMLLLYRLLHPELSPLCERGPCQPPWLTRQTRPAGRRPPGPKGHTQLPATSYERRSSAGVESEPTRLWAGSSSSTLLWMVRRS